jgi:hypothetical protein
MSDKNLSTVQVLAYEASVALSTEDTGIVGNVVSGWNAPDDPRHAPIVAARVKARDDAFWVWCAARK